MAEVKCQVCGGSIRMGTCTQCGTTYTIDEIRNIVSGQNQQSQHDNSNNIQSVNNSNAMVSQNRNNDELSRDVLLLHLNDVRIMETFIRQSKLKIKELQDELNAKRKEFDDFANETFPKSPPEKKDICVSGVDYFVVQVSALGLMLSGAVLLFCGFFALLEFSEGYVTRDIGFPLVISIVVTLVFLIAIRIGNKNLDKRKDAIYIRILNEYRSEKEEFERIQYVKISNAENEFKNFKEHFNNSVNDITAQINETKDLLQQAYSVNIIPTQFRNIEGVYYLHDYLSTSNQTFSEALMQFNLEAIKSKLDNMIKLQAESVIQQAITNAKLDETITQNQQILQQVEKSAKYSKISAINSEVTKLLTQKSLAYQKADFWLKQIFG